MAIFQSPMLHIRPFHPSDSDAVIALWQTCDLIRPRNGPAKDIARKLKTQPHLFLVGLLNDQIIATAMAGYEGHRGWINYLAVHPDHRRHGHARQIMNEAERLLRLEGCPKINLQVRTSNKDVIAFYHRIGFQTDEVLSMGKRLEPD